MKYIGNFVDWIDEQGIIEHLTSCQGDCTPVWQPDRWKGNTILEKFTEIYPANVIRYDLESYIKGHRGLFFQDRNRFPSTM